MTTDHTDIFKAIAAALYREAGCIPFPWHIDDVRHVAECREIVITLTDEDCLAVLENARDNHSAEFGMGWDEIEAELRCLAECRDEESAGDTERRATLDLLRGSLAHASRLAAELTSGEGDRP